MRVLVVSALMLLVILLGGAQLRIAKITIKEPGRSRTVIHVCLPGRDPNVSAMTDKDFMYHTYDWYGFRHLGGFGLATRDFGKAAPLKTDPDVETPPVIPGGRDLEVLEALLLHLLAESGVDLTSVPTNQAEIVLHVRTPEKTGFLLEDQMRGDVRSHALPSDLERDLRQRNSKADAGPGPYEAVAAFYTNLAFSSGIAVRDLSEVWKQRPSFFSFKEACPKARGWVEAYLPGYTKDGTRAVVRAMVGPWAHAASITALLERCNDKWVVKWYEVARYA
jgi:hypothetical protein